MRKLAPCLASLALALCGTAANAETAAPDGGALYSNNCAKCHGPDGSGATKMGKKLHVPDFRKERWQSHHTDDELQKAVREGVVEQGKRRMPPFNKKLTEEQIRAVAAHVRTFRPAAEAPAAAPEANTDEAKPAQEGQEPKAEPRAE